MKNFRTRLAIWLKRPLAYKLLSLNIKFHNFIYGVTLLICKYLYAKNCLKNLFRKIAFDITPHDQLLIGISQSEKFVISAEDKEIGRTIFLEPTRPPYGFEKINDVIAILGPSHKNELLIDVGANIGTICIPAIKRGYFKQAIAIEPEPLNYLLLTTNIALNQVSEKISPKNIACGTQDNQTLTMEVGKGNHGDHRIRLNSKPGLHFENERDTVSVMSHTLDSIIGDVNPNSCLIWMDTQGFEGHILSGAKKALTARVPLYVEFWPYGMNRLDSYELLVSAIITNNYNYFYDLDDPKIINTISRDTLQKLYDKHLSQGTFTDLVIIA